jgi:hypothetical protein
MGWVEVIRLRIPLQERAKTLGELNTLLKNCGAHTDGPFKITKLLGLLPVCDIALVISWPDEYSGAQPSRLSSNLSTHLERYGLVSNSAWLESQPIHWPEKNNKETEDENFANQP